MINAKLKTESLTVGYNGVPLISDINIAVKKGEILTLIGPNGSGKSTILKSITRHLAAISGTVFIDGKNLRLMSGKEMSVKMSVVLTERVRPDLTTCRDLVSAGRYPYTGGLGLLNDHDRDVVEKSLGRVNALDIADKYVTEISDGQRQRILLARAICQEPEIIVLDEPTSFLDIKHKIELLEILSDMAKKEKIAVVMSLHEIDLAERISDRIACVKGDRISVCGTPEEIFSDANIADLYGLDNGYFNALLGCIELYRQTGGDQYFVIGGNGTGIPFYRSLRKKGIPFAAGILQENDIDTAVARPLAQKLICSEAFMPVTDAVIEDAKKTVDASVAVIDCGCPAGDYNRANAELLEYARSCGKKIYRSISELPEVET